MARKPERPAAASSVIPEASAEPRATPESTPRSTAQPLATSPQVSAEDARDASGESVVRDGAQGARAPFVPSFTWDDPVRLMKSLGVAWREVTDRETPTFLQLIELGVERVDVDAPTGFVAVHVAGEAHHAIGLRREAIVPLVSVLSGHSAAEVERALSQGPAKLEAKPEKRKKPTTHEIK